MLTKRSTAEKNDSPSSALQGKALHSAKRPLSALNEIVAPEDLAKALGLNVEKYLAFLLEKRPQHGLSDEELEKPTPWSEEARIYCGFAQQIAFT